MRYYIGNKTIPAAEVTWDDLCNPGAVVRWDEDPEADVSARLKFEMRQAPLRIANMLKINESKFTGIQLIIWKIYSFFKVEK